MKLVVLGLSITSSWGNGHATTYRSLLRGCHELGHETFFLERDVPWYAAQRDMPEPQFCEVLLYNDLEDLRSRMTDIVESADAVIVGSYVPEGIAVCKWVLATAKGVRSFYDIDTPKTLAKLNRGECEYMAVDLISKFEVYFSFAGGPILYRLEREYGSPAARALYCSVDTEVYFPERVAEQWALGYLGTYSPDRQGTLERFLIGPASRLPGERFVVAGSQYPPEFKWPKNVEHINHLPPDKHRRHYCKQRFTLNITRADMRRAGYSPSVRLFEAAACGTPIISDFWEGIENFFEPEKEVLIARNSSDVTNILRDLSYEELSVIGARARSRVLRDHTARRRAEELTASLDNAVRQSKSNFPS
jgi:spore maturation protein CgeB